MTVNDQINILDNKIKSNQVQYDLGREAANFSVFSSKNFLDKYEYLTDLGYKPNLFEKAKFEYSLLGSHLVKYPKKMRLKVLLRASVISIIIA